MEAKLERLEVEPVLSDDDDLAVDHAAVRQRAQERLVEFRKIAVERPQVPALDEDGRVAAKDDGAKPVPLRLVEPAAAGGEFLDQLGEHRLDRGRDGERGGFPDRRILLVVAPPLLGVPLTGRHGSSPGLPATLEGEAQAETDEDGRGESFEHTDDRRTA